MKYGGLVELFVVLMFVAGWGILELVTRRMDRNRTAQDHAGSGRDRGDPLTGPGDPRPGPADAPASAAAQTVSKESPRHPER